MYRTNDNLIDPPVIRYTELIDGAVKHVHVAPKKYIAEQRKETALYNVAVDFISDRQEITGLIMLFVCVIAAYIMARFSA